MNSSQINQLLKSHPDTRDRFIGTFPFDTVPQLDLPIHQSFFVVINQDPADMSGSHWVALEINLPNPDPNDLLSMYFDSYGLAPPKYMKPSIENAIGKDYIFNKKSLQAAMTTTCGQWCMLYILQRCRNNSIKNFLDTFSTRDLESNDMIVNALIEKEFNVDLDVRNVNFLQKRGLLQKENCGQNCKCRHENECMGEAKLKLLERRFCTCIFAAAPPTS